MKRARDMPVDWSEGADTPRPDYAAEYSDASALPGVVHEALRFAPHLPAVFGQLQLLSLRLQNRETTQDAGLIAGLLLKMLRRGRLPRVTLGVERDALIGYELASAVRELKDGDAEVGWTADQQSKKLRVNTESILAAAVQRSAFDPGVRVRPWRPAPARRQRSRGAVHEDLGSRSRRPICRPLVHAAGTAGPDWRSRPSGKRAGPLGGLTSSSATPAGIRSRSNWTAPSTTRGAIERGTTSSPSPTST